MGKTIRCEHKEQRKVSKKMNECNNCGILLKTQRHRTENWLLKNSNIDNITFLTVASGVVIFSILFMFLLGETDDYDEFSGRITHKLLEQGEGNNMASYIFQDAIQLSEESEIYTTYNQDYMEFEVGQLCEIVAVTQKIKYMKCGELV